jgi:hypothetical protein
MESAEHDARPQAKETQMKYMLLIYVNEAARASASQEEINPAYIAYAQAMQKAGVMVGGDRLTPPSSATTVRTIDGKTKVLNGPYADTKEQLGGYFMIEAPDLDAAIAWATRCPGASQGVIEVRPIFTM